MTASNILTSPEFLAMMEEFGARAKLSAQKKYQTLNELAPKGGIVLVGDSIVDYFPMDELLPGCYNRGVAGDTSTEMLTRFDKTVLPLCPRQIVIWVGTNDIQSGIPLEKTLKNLETAIEMAKGAKILLLSVAPVNVHSDDAFIRGTVGLRNNDIIRTMNREYRNLANRKRAIFVDIYAELEQEGTLPDFCSDDGLHLTVPAYQVVCRILKEALAETEHMVMNYETV